MIDQRVSEGKNINFFGKSALTTTLPAQLAEKFNLKLSLFLSKEQITINLKSNSLNI